MLGPRADMKLNMMRGEINRYVAGQKDREIDEKREGGRQLSNLENTQDVPCFDLRLTAWIVTKKDLCC